MSVRRPRLAIEVLEDRAVPAQFTVELLTPGAGRAGYAAATFTRNVALNTALPTAGAGARVDAPDAAAGGRGRPRPP